MVGAAATQFRECRRVDRRGSGGSLLGYRRNTPLGDRAIKPKRQHTARVAISDACCAPARDCVAGPVGMSVRHDTWAIVLAGGDGVRLRSLTIDSRGRPVPKQYCSLFGGPTANSTV